MEIKLVSMSDNYLKNIWVAARTCYSPLSPVELSEQGATNEEMLRLANHIITSKHSSVLEHCHMTFAVKNVSRTLLAQYSRHRVAVSLSVQSQRYVSEQSNKNPGGIFDFVIPVSIEKNPEAKKVYSEFMQACQAKYDELTALGVKKEDARFVLPGGAGTNFVTSLNLRSFFDVYTKRVITPGAQWEIKEMLVQMRALLVAKEPWLAQYLPEK
ncbi:MAG TPA: FAD-dependent thymidylate synthase [Candidatus Avacidaminococcus intestinavium]|uniref:FAD-dependent thymidylate synthase n=1 Tax=Candidatus Avacidaminococcus intestinavium TaxID=2840684 RepID=A0A9D1SKR6_9FIRM|nr:FAD-dependent thymidylate synthase [Candidatus Avacidaminococcus intestinavium]